MPDGPTHPASPDEGFPNPHSADYQGERTPAEQHEYEQQQAARDAANADPDARLASDQNEPGDTTAQA